jgi:hypothetical protein
VSTRRLSIDLLPWSVVSTLVNRIVCLVGVALCVWPSSVALADERALAGRPTLQIPRLPKSPTIDGFFTEGEWTGAAYVNKLTQEKPVDGAPATEDTDFWLAYDSNYLYVAAHAHYKDRSLMRVNRAQRDRHSKDDRVSIYLDTFLDQQRSYKFTVNGFGVQGDAITRAFSGQEDASWDALYSSSGHVVEDGWIVEVAIPFKSIRYPERKAGEEHRWGLQLHRSLEGRDEDDMWSPVSRDIPGFLTQMGVAYGIRDLSTSRNLEILPAVTGAKLDTLDPSTGTSVTGDPNPDAGVSVKYGLTSTLTLDATVNPDFSQIEADRPQITVNQRFPIFYEERRPFFLEGQDVFGIGSGINLLHTRSIVDPLLGAKITGKVGKTSLGLMLANDEAPGRVDDVADPAYGRKAAVVASRLRYDYASESYIGALFTDREFLDSHNRVIAVDGRLKLSSAKRLFFAAGASSDRHGDGSTTGYIYQASLSHTSRNLNWNVLALDYSPEFATDLGFFRRVDVREAQGTVSWAFFPEGALQSWTPRVHYERTYSHAGDLTDNQIEVGLNARFVHNVNVKATAYDDMERFAGINFNKRRYSVGGDASFSRLFSFGGQWNWGDGIRYSSEPFLGRATGGNVNVTLRPRSWLETSASVNRSRLVDPRSDTRVFDVTTYRWNTQVQFSGRMQLRPIFEYDNFSGKLGANVLLTYRINSGTVAYLGLDDRRQKGINLNPELFPTTAFRRTNRSLFMKVSYLFRM